MGAEKHVSTETYFPVEEMWSALIDVVQRGEYDIGGLSNELHQMLFRSGGPASSPGHLYAVTVLPSGDEPVESFAVLDDGTKVPWTEGDYPGA